MQEYITFPLPTSEQELKDRIEGNGVTEGADLVVDAIWGKASDCQMKLQQIQPGQLREMTCEQFVSKGLEMGWVNPYPEEFAVLFAAQYEQYEAGEETHARCESEYNAALKDRFPGACGDDCQGTDGGSEGSDEMPSGEQIARDTQAGTCGEFLRNMQDYVTWPLPLSEHELKARIESHGIQGAQHVVNSIWNKASHCQMKLQEI